MFSTISLWYKKTKHYENFNHQPLASYYSRNYRYRFCNLRNHSYHARRAYWRYQFCSVRIFKKLTTKICLVNKFYIFVTPRNGIGAKFKTVFKTFNLKKMNFTCPLPDEINDIPQVTCPVDFDQIIMFIFQRVQSPASFSPTTLKALATWTPLLTAADSTKVVATPKFAECTIPASAALTQGGNDNTTIGGIPYYNGEGFVAVTAQIPSMPALVKAALANLTQESIANQLGKAGLTVFMVNRYGQIIANQIDETHVGGFPVYNFRVSSVGSAGLNARNKNEIGFDMPGDWDTNAIMSTPSFDVLSSIING